MKQLERPSCVFCIAILFACFITTFRSDYDIDKVSHYDLRLLVVLFFVAFNDSLADNHVKLTLL